MIGFASALKPRGVARAPSYLSHSHSLSLCLVIVILLVIPSARSNKMYVSETDVDILLNDTRHARLIQIGTYNQSLAVTLTPQHEDIVQVVPQTIDIPGNNVPNPTVKITYDISLYGKNPGHSDVIFTAMPAGFINMERIFFRVTVLHSHLLKTISYIIGWMYFLAWSVSFYPQIYINYRRKSVVGLNFDFIALNIMGFVMYSFFNCGLYFSSNIQAEYFRRFPRGLNPVLLNDVFFSVHAAFATLITIRQCFMYERAAQRVSTTARSILGVFAVFATVSACVSAAGKLHWLDFLYYCSYIKLTITLIKYMPQAFMNYRRKSTVGWSIGNILLDFTGGVLSILQMVLNAHNYDDWISFFGDATKFGLGLFSICFDVLFILQHYVFYRKARQLDRMATRSAQQEPDKMTPKTQSQLDSGDLTPTTGPQQVNPDNSTPTTPPRQP